MLVDTHCHIHEADYPLDAAKVLADARESGVAKLICIGTNQQSSEAAVGFARSHDGVFAAVGVHPHDTKDGVEGIAGLLGDDAIVAIGEIGLDYYYTHSPKHVQVAALEQQLQLARDHSLPVSFHVRDAFDDFWPIFDNFSGLRGVLHSFTDTVDNLERGLSRQLYIGVNGISTFTKDTAQQAMFRSIPLERLLLETDAPFLTPSPHRGKVNTPSRVREVALHQATVRNMSVDVIMATTTRNASTLFGI
jgi:TatD DNase family protein